MEKIFFFNLFIFLERGWERFKCWQVTEEEVHEPERKVVGVRARLTHVTLRQRQWQRQRQHKTEYKEKEWERKATIRPLPVRLRAILNEYNKTVRRNWTRIRNIYRGSTEDLQRMIDLGIGAREWDGDGKREVLTRLGSTIIYKIEEQ